MVDTSIFKLYIEKPSEEDNSYARLSIEYMGFDKWFDSQIKYWINCSYISSNGNRIIQTNDKRYNYEITTTICMIEEYGEDKKDYYYEKLITRHNSNLEFEAINGLSYDPYAVKGSKSPIKRRNNKQTTLDFGDKPKKETTAERKLKAHVAKISNFKITLKPVNNGN